MRNSAIGSMIVHVGVLAALLVVRRPTPLVVPGPEVIQVALTDMPLSPTPVPPKVEPAPEPKPETIKPVEEEGVKLQPDRRPKKKKEPEREQTRPAPAALPSAAVGSAGLRGDVGVEGGNFEFTYYLVLIRNRIASNWAPPGGLSTGGAPVRTVVYFKIARGGEVSDMRVEAVSGVEYFDRAAVRAVTLSDPMPPLPLGYSGASLGVHFGFEWESP